MKIKKLFCKHDYEICTKEDKYFSLNGETLYKVCRHYKICRKCGKVKKYIFRKYEGFGYK